MPSTNHAKADQGQEIAIQVRDLHYRYRGGHEALRGVSLTIKKGTRAVFLGPNGAGKSTLLLHFNGTYLPSQGQVEVFGQEINARTERWAKGQVGLVFQDPDDQVFCSTVEEDIAFGPTNLGWTPEEVQRRVQEVVAALGLEKLAPRPPHQLSYGEKKRVAIAGILAMQPQVIVFDEPTAFLDPKSRLAVWKIMDSLSNQGKTVIVATHDVDLAAEWAEQVFVLKEGRLLVSGTPDILTDQEVVEAADLSFPTVTEVFRRAGQLTASAPQDHGLKTMGAKNLPKTIAEAAQLIAGLLASLP